jgi:acylphosphatase
MNVVNRQVFYSGLVQGVGFRYSVKQIASGYEVVGWVRNLPDGRVELQAGGEEKEVDAFLAGIAESHLSGYIRQVDRHDLDAPSTARGFQIRH